MLTSHSRLFGEPAAEQTASETSSVLPCSAPAKLGDDDYEFLCRLVFERSRINLGPGKRELVSSRIAKRLRTLRIPSFADYCDYLRSPQGVEEITDLMDVISTNVTDFFREPTHFEFLQQTALPDWLKSFRNAATPFRIWSAACSSGEEPYSIAMVLAHFFQSRGNFAWQVDASDISTRMLARAREGIYRGERMQLPSPEWLPRYFQKGIGAYTGQYRVKSELRDRISFHHLNLFDVFPFTSPFDMIFCRNVMIYFDRPTQENLVSRLRDQLAPGGHLIVGHSESLIGIRHNLKGIQPSIYRRE